GGITVDSSLHDTLTTQTINQMLEHSAGDYTASSPATLVQTTVQRTDYGWSTNPTESAVGTTGVPGGTITINFLPNDTDNGSASVVTITNSSAGSSDPSVTVPGYASLTPNSTRSTGNGGGHATWFSHANTSLNATKALQAGVTLVIQNTSNSDDLGA